jgi:hypothetical protein
LGVKIRCPTAQLQKINLLIVIEQIQDLTFWIIALAEIKTAPQHSLSLKRKKKKMSSSVTNLIPIWQLVVSATASTQEQREDQLLHIQ